MVYKQFGKKIGLLGFTNVFVAILSVVLIPILTKNLNVNDYGIWIQFTVIMGLLLTCTTFGLPFTMVRYISPLKKKSEIKEVFYSIFFFIIIITSIVAFAFFIFHAQIAELIFGGNIQIALILPVALLITSINSLFLNYFRAFMQMKKYSFIVVFEASLSTILIYLLISYGLKGIISGYLITLTVVMLVLFILVIKQISFTFPKFKDLRQYLSFGLPTVPANLSYWVIDSSDRLIIGLILGSSFVGYYSPAYAVGNLILMVFSPFFWILPSILSKEHDKGNLDVVKKILQFSLKYCLLLAIPAAFVLSLLSQEILTILSTPDIASNAFYITPFIALGTIMNGVQGIYSNTFILEKKTKKLGFVWILVAFLNFVLTIMFVPFIGLLGAAVMTMISYLIALILTYYYTNSKLRFNINYRFIAKSIFASLIFSLIILVINPKGILMIILVLGLGFIVYLAILYLIGGFKRDELNALKDIFQFH